MERRGALVVSGLVKHRARKDTEVHSSWTRRIYIPSAKIMRARKEKENLAVREKNSLARERN